jgi:hypothetical protein
LSPDGATIFRPDPVLSAAVATPPPVVPTTTPAMAPISAPRLPSPSAPEPVDEAPDELVEAPSLIHGVARVDPSTPLPPVLRSAPLEEQAITDEDQDAEISVLLGSIAEADEPPSR